MSATTDLILALRKFGLSQSEISRRTSIPQPRLSRWESGDTPDSAERLLGRLLAFRIFADAAGKMNRCLTDIDGELLLLPQFTLVADTTRGNRPGFEPAAAPALGQELFEHLATTARARWPRVQTGRFGADMEVELVNSGPVTFSLRVPPDPEPLP